MKNLSKVLIGFLAFVLLEAPTTVTKPTHITVNPASVVPTNVIVDQGGAACTNNFSAGCVTNTQTLFWTAASGASSYTISRNGSTLATGVTCCTFVDNTATNSNIVNTYGDETTYAYTVAAVISGVTGTGIGASSYMYTNGANQSCGNFSGGGFGGFQSTAVQMTYNTANGHVATITVNSGSVFPYQGFTDQSGVIPSSSLNNGTGNMYILPYGTNGTTGTGTGTGTYWLSALPTGNATSDNIWADPSPTVGGGAGLEACPVTTDTVLTAFPGHTFMLGAYYTNGGGFMQQFTGQPQSPQFDMNASAMNNFVVDFFPTDALHTFFFTVHSRPGGQSPNTGDIFSTRGVSFATAGTSAFTSDGLIHANAWNHITVPMATLGLGRGAFTGYVTANWHGTATVSGGTLTIVSTIDGSPSNIVAGDYISVLISNQGWQCGQATGPASGSTVPVTNCPEGSLSNQATAMPAYDAQLCASALITSPGPDNAAALLGNSEPSGTFIDGQQAGFGSVNPTGVGSCTGTGPGHWGLFNGNGSTITSQGSSGSQISWSNSRVSVYKPEILGRGPSSNIAVAFDNYGFTP
jgi:hypothetical protein